MVLARRGFLGALALVPAALAGCASGSRASRGGEGAPSLRRPPPDERRDARLAAVRSHPLAADAEPALVFRAAAARPGEP